MKRLLSISALLISLLLCAQAQAAGTAPANMTASSAIVGSQIVWCPTGLTADFKCTFTQVAAYINSLVSGDCTATGTGTFTCLKTNGTSFGTAAVQNTGTSGATLPFLNGTNTWSGAQTFGNVFGSINAQSGTTYTLASTDCGKTVVITNASAIALTTLNSIPAGCAIAVEQGGAGQITVNNGAGATFTSAHSYTKTFNAAGAIIGLFVDTNSGTNAHFVLTGDGA